MPGWQADLSPQAHKVILEQGLNGSPEEVCGIILPPDYVVRLPNRVTVDLRANQYEVHHEDVVEAVAEWVEMVPGAKAHLDGFDFVVWHTHPNGFIGPSRRDLVVKRSLYNDASRVRFLVISLPDGEAAFF